MSGQYMHPSARNTFQHAVTKRLATKKATSTSNEEMSLETEEGLKEKLRTVIRDHRTSAQEVIAASRLLADISGWFKQSKSYDLSRMTEDELLDLLEAELFPLIKPWGIFKSEEAVMSALAERGKLRRGSYQSPDKCLRCEKRPYWVRVRRLCRSCYRLMSRKGKLDELFPAVYKEGRETVPVASPP